jgi:hypothetical protein
LNYIGNWNQPSEAGAARIAIDQGFLTKEHIAQFGFFKKFEDEYLDLYAPIVDSNELRNGANPTAADARVEALKPATQWRLLGHAIPASSYAVAVNPLNRLNSIGGQSRNFNMHSLRELPNGDDGLPLWPQERIKGDPEIDYDWLHSDFRNVAMPYVYKMYEAMLDTGDLRGKQ